MRNCRILSAILALVMLFAIVPVAAFAEGVEAIADEAAAMSKLDTTWAALEAAEAEALAHGAGKVEVINAVYEAALNSSLVDSDSFSDFTDDGFNFTVDGMYNAYNYRLRNEINTDCEPVKEGIVVVEGTGNGAPLKDAESPNVLLVAPYYGHDGNFTDQYKIEAQSIANATGGEYTLIQSTAATGPAIAELYTDKGVVIYDSHGVQTGTSSYLCLTTNAGITEEDYSNGWAVRAGSAAYIDGRYIENHVTDTLSNCIVWMAICEGMKRQGQGTTGYALLRAGAGCVYGYSQSVTFIGDYTYEETFWTAMKDESNPATVAEAYAIMIDEHGIPDPYGDAYPIVMSDVDEFPENPDGPQEVNCEWILFGEGDPIALENFSLEVPQDLDLMVGEELTIKIIREPERANLYEAVWTSSDESVVAVEGNNRRGKLYAAGRGTATVTCSVYVDGELFGAEEITINVSADEELAAALNAAGNNFYYGTGTEYPFEVVEADGRVYGRSSNKRVINSESYVNLTITMEAGETLSFDYIISSQSGCDIFEFNVNGDTILSLSGVNPLNWNTYTFTAEESGVYRFEWIYTKDAGVSHGEDRLMLDEIAYSGSEYVPPVPPENNGDIDGDGVVTIADAIFALRHTIGSEILEGDALLRGDVDGNGVVNMVDAIAIMRLALGR